MGEHWRDRMVADLEDRRILAGCPDWLLALAVLALLGLVVWSSGSWPRIVATLGLHLPW